MAPKKNKNKGSSNGYFNLVIELSNKMDRVDAEREASRMWPRMSAQEREPYNIRAQRSKCSNFKMTSLQENLDVVKKTEADFKMQEQTIQDDIKAQVRFLTDSNTINEEYFHIMHVNNFFVTTTNDYYPAEIALVRFNFGEGVLDKNVYHSLIRPGAFPIGYKGQAKIASENTHKIDYLHPEDINIPDVCKEIFEFLRESSRGQKLPTIYVKDDFKSLVKNVMCQMADMSGYDSDVLTFCNLSFLLFTLRNNIRNTNVWPSISQSINELDRDVYDYTPEIPCDFHKDTDTPIYCSRSHAIRMAFILCDNCCTDLGVALVPGRHLPKHSATEPIVPSRAPSVAYKTPAASYATSISHSYRTNMDTVEFDDICTVTDDQDLEWSEVRSSRTVRSNASNAESVKSGQAAHKQPQTDWRETTFGRGRGRGLGPRK